MSLNRWVFKWRLEVRMFLHSRISVGREFQEDGGWSSDGESTPSSLVCVRGTTSSGASNERGCGDVVSNDKEDVSVGVAYRRVT